MSSTIKEYLLADSIIHSKRSDWTNSIKFTPNQYIYLTRNRDISITGNGIEISTGPPEEYKLYDENLNKSTVNSDINNIMFGFLLGTIFTFIIKR